jgi:hypothetical protein
MLKSLMMRWCSQQVKGLENLVRHSIIIYSTISKITVRPREIETGGTGVTSNHDNEAHRGLDSVFYSLT